MSRFIPEGESDMKVLEKIEQQASQKFQNEEEEKEALSLYEQMRLNHLLKEQEYQEKVKARNQPHKIDEREQQFYKELQEKRDEKEASRKRDMDEGLAEFERMKRLQTEKLPAPNTTSVSFEDVITKTKKRKLLVRPKSSKTTPVKQEANENDEENVEKTTLPTETEKLGLISGYSSSSTDSDAEE